MAVMVWLNIFADLATIATACVAVYAYGFYRLTIWKRMKIIEAMLEKKSLPIDDTLLIEQIAGDLMLTVEQVLDSASRSKKIEGCGDVRNQRRLRFKRSARVSP